MNYVRLPLIGSRNTRDLGGYPTLKSVTKFNAILRSDDITNLNECDKKFLKKYGLKNIIDLRSKSEVETNPNPYENDSEYNYINISLMKEVAPEKMKEMQLKMMDRNFLVNFYIEIIDNLQDKVKQVLDYILNSEGVTMYHCTAGKDRTGVISMLILGVAGVKKEDIISNYEVTYTNIKKNPIFLKYKEEAAAKGQEFPEYILQSNAETIEKTINHLIEKYGSFEKYFQEIGYSEAEIEKFIKKIEA